MLKDDAIREGKIKPTKEDRKRMGLDPVKPGPKPKDLEKQIINEEIKSDKK